MDISFDGDPHWALISQENETTVVNESTLLDAFTAWECWMSFWRLLAGGPPATMVAYFDDGSEQPFRVIPASLLNQRCTYNNPTGDA